MVIDSSAVLAVLLGEEDATYYAQAIDDSEDPQMSTISALEVALVIGARKRDKGLAALELFLEKSGIQLVAFDLQQFRLAKEAWWKYGKGRHAAGLNLGDCCSYALAKATGEPLLYKGSDFSRTDVVAIRSAPS